MPSFCKHVFVAGPKKGQSCEKFLREQTKSCAISIKSSGRMRKSYLRKQQKRVQASAPIEIPKAQVLPPTYI